MGFSRTHLPPRAAEVSRSNPPTPLVGAGRAIGALAVDLCTLAKTSYAYSSARFLFFRACVAGDDFSLRRACRATGESALEEFLCFGVVAALVLARLQGHWGQRFGGVFLDGFWQCRSCITIMGPKVDEVGPKMAPTQP